MKRTLIACLVLAVLSASHSASAADMRLPLANGNVPALYDWTGFYLGVNGGWDLGQSNQTQIGPPSLSTGNFSLSGGLAGGTAGFNLQIDHSVIGVEGDVDWLNLSGSASCPTAGFTCATNSDYLATLRARLGLAWDRWLPFVTAGAALGDVKQSFSPAIGVNNGATSNSVGWTAGGGVQFVLWDSWSAKVDYLHVDLGTFVCTVACSGTATHNIGTTLTEEIVRAGINYRF